MSLPVLLAQLLGVDHLVPYADVHSVAFIPYRVTVAWKSKIMFLTAFVVDVFSDLLQL